MHYDKVKRDKTDFCNICGKYENLTWDHVPPKCCNNMYPIRGNPGGQAPLTKCEQKFE